MGSLRDPEPARIRIDRGPARPGRTSDQISLKTLKEQSTDSKRPDWIMDEQDAAYHIILIEQW